MRLGNENVLLLIGFSGGGKGVPGGGSGRPRPIGSLVLGMTLSDPASGVPLSAAACDSRCLFLASTPQDHLCAAAPAALIEAIACFLSDAVNDLAACAKPLGLLLSWEERDPSRFKSVGLMELKDAELIVVGVRAMGDSAKLDPCVSGC